MPGPALGPEVVRVGGTPLAIAAAPLLQLLSRLRNTLSQPDPGDLRERAVREVRHFEQASRDAGVPMDQLRPAHYALCASLDDVVLATPWGSQGAWAARSLISTFHQEVRSGERFFDVLNQVKQNPGTFLPVIELMYLCMSLGFQGRYRLSPRGPAELDRVREETYGVITRQRPAPNPELSPHWKGADAPYRPTRASVPVWVGGAAALAIIGGLFAWFSTGLNGESDTLFARMMAAPPDANAGDRARRPGAAPAARARAAAARRARQAARLPATRDRARPGRGGRQRRGARGPHPQPRPVPLGQRRRAAALHRAIGAHRQRARRGARARWR